MTVAAQPLDGILVVDLSRYLPGAYASRELLRLGARVVRVESPAGDPMRHTAPAWDMALRRGKESVVCDLRANVELVATLCARADVVIEGFRPGVAARLGIGPDHVPRSVVYCSLTGFGDTGRHANRAGHDLNYLGWAGALEDTPSCPPLPIADLAAGALGAIVEILAALVRRGRTGEGARIVVSMTHRAHDLVEHRLGGDGVPRMLTGDLACYRVYPTADGRYLTVAALEPRFFARLCTLVGLVELAPRQYDDDQDAVAAALGAALTRRPLDEWLARFEGEDVCVGPVASRSEAQIDLGPWPQPPEDVPLGAHTEQWLAALGLAPTAAPG